MRTPLLLACLGLASLIPTPKADACGGYADFVPMVTSISGHLARETARDGFRQRNFVLLGEAATGNLTWRAIAEHSYDSTQIADAGRLEQPIALTLVGAGGTRTVEASRRVALRHTWEFDGAQLAVEVDGAQDQHQFAILGSSASTKFIALVKTDDAGGQQVPGTKATTELVSTNGTAETVVRIDGRETFRSVGYATGAIVWHGSRFVLIESRGTVMPVRI